MATFVLVHGAFEGAWIWRDFADMLRSVGHEVYTPTLTGLGERSHLGGPDVTLKTHIEDVINVLEFEDLREITLVGHSYAGMVIAGAADTLPGRLKHLVFVDAFVPRDGEAVFDLISQQPLVAHGWQIVGWNGAVTLKPPNASDWIWERRRPQPVGTYSEPISLRLQLEERDFSRSFIKALSQPRPPAPVKNPLWEAYDRVRDNPSWRTYEMPCGHGVQLEMPNRLKEILEEIAAQAR